MNSSDSTTAESVTFTNHSKRNTKERLKSKLIRDEKNFEKESFVMKQMEWIRGIAIRIDNQNKDLSKKRAILKQNYEGLFHENIETTEYHKKRANEHQGGDRTFKARAEGDTTRK